MAKPRKIQLSIPNPCKEDWHKMTPGEQGRFCSNCQQSVVDFSTYTDRELLEYFNKAKDRVCGRISNHQLNRLIVANTPTDTPIFRRLLLGAAITAGVTGVTQAQNNTTSNSTKNTTQNTIKQNEPANDSSLQISGSVIDSATKEPLPFVNLAIENDANIVEVTMTDQKGIFKFNLTEKLLGKKLTILTQYYAYYGVVKCFTFSKLSNKNITIPISENPNTPDSVTISVGRISIDSPPPKTGTK